MTVTLDERIATIKEIIWTVGAFAPLPEELASLHRMIKTNDPALEETLNAFFGKAEDSNELDDMFGDNP